MAKRGVRKKTKKKVGRRRAKPAPKCIHSDRCYLCGKKAEIYPCKYDWCNRPGRHYAFWMTTNAKWKKLPTKLRSKTLCKRCFKQEAGVAPGPQYWG